MVCVPPFGVVCAPPQPGERPGVNRGLMYDICEGLRAMARTLAVDPASECPTPPRVVFTSTCTAGPGAGVWLGAPHYVCSTHHSGRTPVRVRLCACARGRAPGDVRQGACARVRAPVGVRLGACACGRAPGSVRQGACARGRAPVCARQWACAWVRALVGVRQGACARGRAPVCARQGACACVRAPTG